MTKRDEYRDGKGQDVPLSSRMVAANCQAYFHSESRLIRMTFRMGRGVAHEHGEREFHDCRAIRHGVTFV